MWHNIMRSTKSKKVSVLHYSIYIYIREMLFYVNFMSYYYVSIEKKKITINLIT